MNGSNAFLKNGTNNGTHGAGHGLHAHKAGGQGEVHFVALMLFVGFFVHKLQPHIFRGAIPYTVLLLVFGVTVGGFHLMTIYDYSKSPPVYAGHVNAWDPIECDENDATCASMWTGNFFKLVLMNNVDPHAIMFVFLPPLIFESAFYVDAHIFLRAFKSIVAMAVVGVIVASTVTALFVMAIYPNYTVNAKVDLTVYGQVLPALLLGTTLSATDPVAVVSLLNSLGAPKALATLIEGESLLNDGTAYGLFLLFLELTKFNLSLEDAPEYICDSAHEVPGCVKDYSSVGTIVVMFALLVFGAVLIGGSIGYLSTLTIAFIYDNKVMECMVTVIAAYGAWIAGEACRASGVLAVVACGVVMGMHKEMLSDESTREFVKEFWEVVCYILNTILFVISGIMIGFNIFDSRNRISFFKDFGLLLILYVVIHVARAVALAVLQPCLNKGVCKGKYSRYDFDHRHSIVMWWGGLRGAVGLALALIVAHDPFWKALDDRYCNIHKCCGDGTEGSGTCWQKKLYFQTAFGEIFMFQVGLIVFLTIVVNGITTGKLVKYFNLQKGESLLDKARFSRVCQDMDNELFKKMKMLQSADEKFILRGVLSRKSGSRIQWDQVYRYLPIADQVVFDQRISRGLIKPHFGDQLDMEHPKRLRHRWKKYVENYSMSNLTLYHSESGQDSSIVFQNHDAIDALKMRSQLHEEALELNDLRVKYINLVKENYWELLSEGYLPVQQLDILKNAENAQKDRIDKHIWQMNQTGFGDDSDSIEELSDLYLQGGNLNEFRHGVEKHAEPPPFLSALHAAFKMVPGLASFIASTLNRAITRDYSLIENFVHAHREAIHELHLRHNDLAKYDYTLDMVVHEAKEQVAEAMNKLDGLGRLYENVIERHETVTATAVLLNYEIKLIKRKIESGELEEEDGHKLLHHVYVSKQKLKSHPVPKVMNTTLEDYLDRALLADDSPANFMKYMALRMPENVYSEFKIEVLSHAHGSPLYLRAHDLLYIKGKPDLHLGGVLQHSMGFYLLLRGKVSIVDVKDEIEMDMDEREKAFEELQTRSSPSKRRMSGTRAQRSKSSLPRLEQGKKVETEKGEEGALKILEKEEPAVSTSEINVKEAATVGDNIVDDFICWLKTENEQPKTARDLEALISQYRESTKDEDYLGFKTTQVALDQLETVRGHLKKFKSSRSTVNEIQTEDLSTYNHLRALSKTSKHVTKLDSIGRNQTFGEMELNSGATGRKFSAVCNTPTLLFYISETNFGKLRRKYTLVDNYAKMRGLYHMAKANLNRFGKNWPALVMEGFMKAFDKFSDGQVCSEGEDVRVPEGTYFVHLRRDETSGVMEIECKAGPDHFRLGKNAHGIIISEDIKKIRRSTTFSIEKIISHNDHMQNMSTFKKLRRKIAGDRIKEERAKVLAQREAAMKAATTRNLHRANSMF
jgi:NhaP-type Na+/H+ or K+/H+ antiporter